MPSTRQDVESNRYVLAASSRTVTAMHDVVATRTPGPASNP